MLTTEVQQQYDWLTKSVGAVPELGRTLIEITGADRATLLHNLCTADIQRLQPVEGTEAFLTDASGKILAHVYLFAEAERIVMETVLGQGEMLVSHLDRYIFREDVQLADRSQQWQEWFLGGPEAAQVMEGLTGQKPPENLLSHLRAELKTNSAPVWIRRVDWTSTDGFLLQFAAEDVEKVKTAISERVIEAGGGICSQQVLDIARVEAGTPLYGPDISHENLPQEIDRDLRAISFTKGCYIGQETVARIDALGHVNKKLRQVQFTSDKVPEVGTELLADGKAVGKVTSAVFSPKHQAPLALAFVRRGHESSGTALESAVGSAKVL